MNVTSRSRSHSSSRRLRRLAVPVLAAPLLGLAACGGDGDGAGGAPSDATSELAAVDPILAGALGGRSLQEAYTAVEEHVQRCMTGLGWEYTVVALDPALFSGELVGPDEAFVATYGYGLSTIDPEDPAALAAVPGGMDPNQEYRRSLPESEGAQYDEDLYGTVETPVEDTGGGAELGGCYGAAVAAELGEGGLRGLDASYRKVEEVVQADPRLVEAEAAWAACMADAGYDFSRPQDAMASIADRLTALGPAAAEAERAALRADELATAKADRACAAAHTDEVLRRVRADAMAAVAGAEGAPGSAEGSS